MPDITDLIAQFRAAIAGATPARTHLEQAYDDARDRFGAVCSPANLTVLLDALDALRVDAERYRWLRERPTYLGWDADYRADEVDAEIDTARGRG